MILVLAHDTAESIVGEITTVAQRAGFACEVSRGDEQLVIGLSGAGDPRALEAALAQRTDVELLPIFSHRDYLKFRSRRRLMTGLAAGMGLLTAIAAGAPVIGFLMPPKGSLSDRTLVRAAGKDEIAEQSAKVVTVLGKRVLLVRLDRERYFALSAICTHMDICQLEWKSERRELVCPCHGGAFDVYGNVVHGPPSIPLASYPVESIGDQLYIRREV